MQAHRYCLVTCVRNEGPYLLEWLAHYRGLGVQDFLVFSNGSTDGTTELLDHLDARGIVRHLPNPSLAFAPPPHRAALSYAPHHKEFRRADYAIVCDVDEFLQIDLPGRSLDALMHRFGQPDIVSVSELVFGFGGVAAFRDRPVVEQFLLSASPRPGKWKARRGVKSIMRVGAQIADYTNHRPQVDAARLDGIRWVDGRGAPVPRAFVEAGDRGLDCRGLYDIVRLNHYTLRSGEAMLAKYDRGDAVRNDRLEPFYFRRRDAQAAWEDRALALLPSIRAGMDALLTDSGTRRLHAACVDSHMRRIAELKAAHPEYWAAIEAQVRLSAEARDRLRPAVAAE